MAFIESLKNNTVYVLYHPELTTVYYGCTKQDIEARFEIHMSSLAHGHHSNRKLQAVYDAGYTQWQISQLEVLDKDAALALETDLIVEDPSSFNLKKTGGRQRQASHIIVTGDIVNEVLKLKRQGYLQYNIATMVNLSGYTISKIVNGAYDALLRSE